MWQTDNVTIQSSTSVNSEGVITLTWTNTATVISCDVQEINKELVLQKYGFTDADNWVQIFDKSNSTSWVKGNQVKYDGREWLIRQVNSFSKINHSNHTHVILSEVI